MSNDPERAFEDIVGELDYPMLIVTAAAGDEVGGCLVGFATQTSIDPPRFLVCLSEKNRTYRVAGDAEVLVVHLVPEEATELAELFGSETGDDVDKFERCDWQPGPEGVPLLDDCPNRFVGRIVERVAFGDHVGMVLEPFFAEEDPDAGQLGFHRAKRIDPGHEA